MACFEEINTTTYKTLLKDVAKLLGVFDPLYGTLNGDPTVACHIILSSQGPTTYFKVGKVSTNLIDFEESAMQKRLDITRGSEL